MTSNIRTYSPSVRIGNWNEDVCLEEDMLKDFLDKRERGELLIQKAHKLLETILKKTPLSVSRDGFIHFGDKVMVVNPGEENVPPSLTKEEKPRPPTSLSINMNEYNLFMKDVIDVPCNVSASTILTPCVRNTFVVTSVDGSENGSVLRFGQPFGLSTLEGYAQNLKLFSDHRRFNLSSKKSREQVIQLVEETNYLTTWQIVAFQPKQRLEMEGLPIPCNCKIVIKHNKTGEALSVPSCSRMKTMFGLEHEVTARTELDSHKAEKNNNHWVIVSGNPSDEEHTHFDRPIPQPNALPREEEKPSSEPISAEKNEASSGAEASTSQAEEAKPSTA